MPLFEEIASLLVDAGVGQLNVNLFLSQSKETPTGDGPYITLTEYSGGSPRRVHNDVVRVAGVPTVLGEKSGENPHLQVTVRARNFSAARLVARRCYRVLNLRNRRLGTPAVRAVSALVRSGSVATATTLAHGWVTGERVIVSGATQPAYNGVHIIEVTSLTGFSFPVVGSPTTPATGTVVATFPGTWYREIEPMQEPFELGHDATGRPRVVFNLRISKGPS